MKRFAKSLVIALLVGLFLVPAAFAQMAGEGKVYMDTWQDVTVGNNVGTYNETAFGCRTTKTFEFEQQNFSATNYVNPCFSSSNGVMDVGAGKGSFTCVDDKALYTSTLCQKFNNLNVSGNVGFTGGASAVGAACAGVNVGQQVSYGGNVCVPGFNANISGSVNTSGYVKAGY